ncbi:MAG: DUF6599 family protein [Terriglobales bacterium]
MVSWRVLSSIVLLAAAAAAPSLPGPLPDFAGWHKISEAPLQSVFTPAVTRALQEYGLRAEEQATYQRDGRTLQVEAFGFRDASGAYGAFTLLRPANFHPLDMGAPDAAGADGDTRALFFRGPWLLRLNLPQVTSMSADEMRELAGLLPQTGGASQLPTLPRYLPGVHLLDGTVRYSEGPVALLQAVGWLDPQKVGFDFGAEVVTARYDLPQQPEMALISYPTPQISADRFRSFVADHPGVGELRRSGPIVILWHGPATREAASLVGAVHYDAIVTLSEPNPPGIEALPRLVLGLSAVVIIIFGIALAVGLTTGGLRSLLRRRFPRHFGPESDSKQMIRLDLK